MRMRHSNEEKEENPLFLPSRFFWPAVYAVPGAAAAISKLKASIATGGKRMLELGTRSSRTKECAKFALNFFRA